MSRDESAPIGNTLRDFGNAIVTALGPVRLRRLPLLTLQDQKPAHEARDGADGSILGDRDMARLPHQDMAARGHTGHTTANPELIGADLRTHATATVEGLAERSRLREVR